MSFRRQLGSLQRTMPGGGMQMRQMARPLAGPQQNATGARAHGAVGARGNTVISLDRRPLDQRTGYGDPRMAVRQRPMAASMARTAVKQRRQNILFMLAGATGVTALLAAMTSGTAMKYAFVLSLCLLGGYIYLLAQSRRIEVPRMQREYWNRAA